jgi:hypothetical protein
MAKSGGGGVRGSTGSALAKSRAYNAMRRARAAVSSSSSDAQRKAAMKKFGIASDRMQRAYSAK